MPSGRVDQILAGIRGGATNPTPTPTPQAPTTRRSRVDDILTSIRGESPDQPAKEEPGVIQSFLDNPWPTVARIGLPLAGAAIGSIVPVAGTAAGAAVGTAAGAAIGGALGGAAGEALGEHLEGRPIDPTEVAISGALGAIPAGPASRLASGLPAFGKVTAEMAAKAVVPSLAKRAALHAAEGASQGLLGEAVHAGVREGRLPTLEEAGRGLSTGAVLGGTLGTTLDVAGRALHGTPKPAEPVGTTPRQSEPTAEPIITPPPTEPIPPGAVPAAGLVEFRQPSADPLANVQPIDYGAPPPPVRPPTTDPASAYRPRVVEVKERGEIVQHGAAPSETPEQVNKRAEVVRQRVLGEHRELYAGRIPPGEVSVVPRIEDGRLSFVDVVNADAEGNITAGAKLVPFKQVDVPPEVQAIAAKGAVATPEERALLESWTREAARTTAPLEKVDDVVEGRAPGQVTDVGGIARETQAPGAFEPVRAEMERIGVARSIPRAADPPGTDRSTLTEKGAQALNARKASREDVMTAGKLAQTRPDVLKKLTGMNREQISQGVVDLARDGQWEFFEEARRVLRAIKEAPPEVLAATKDVAAPAGKPYIGVSPEGQITLGTQQQAKRIAAGKVAEPNPVQPGVDTGAGTPVRPSVPEGPAVIAPRPVSDLGGQPQAEALARGGERPSGDLGAGTLPPDVTQPLQPIPEAPSVSPAKRPVRPIPPQVLAPTGTESFSPGQDVRVRVGGKEQPGILIHTGTETETTGPAMKGKAKVRLPSGKTVFVNPADVSVSPQKLSVTPAPTRAQTVTQKVEEAGKETYGRTSVQATPKAVEAQMEKATTTQGPIDTTAKPPQAPFNLDRMNLSPENKELLGRMYEAAPEKYEAAKGGKMTFDDFKEMGLKIGGIVTPQDFEKALKNGAPLSDPGMVVYAREVSAKKAQLLYEAKQEVDALKAKFGERPAKPEDIVALEEAQKRFLKASLEKANFDLSLAGAQAQAARTLVAMRILAGERGPLETLIDRIFRDSC